MGLWKGKKGSTVFYKIWNSNNKETQGEREYQATVRNPQSNGQADQRAKLLPAQRIKAALSAIVSRSFQGVPYGAKSRLAFLKNAMQEKTGYPFVTKGYDEPVPGAYLVSRGGLMSLQLSEVAGGFESQFLVNEVVSEDSTIAELSAALLARNSQLADGDQLTFIGCRATLPDTPFVSIYNWAYWSFVLNTADTRTLGEIPGYYDVPAVSFTNSLLAISKEISNTGSIVAAALIVSREGDSGQYLRSTSRIAVGSAMDPWFTAAQRTTTRASYQTSSTTRATDWPVEEDEGISGANIVDALYTLSGLTGDMASLNGQQVRTKFNEDLGEYTAVYVQVEDGEYYPVNASNARLSYLVRDPETQLQEVKYLTTANVPDLADLYKIVV